MTNYDYPYNPNPPQRGAPYRRSAPQNQSYPYPPQPPPPQSYERGGYAAQPSQYAQPPHHGHPPAPSQPSPYNYHSTYTPQHYHNDPNMMRGDMGDEYSMQHAKQQVPPPSSQPPQNSGRPPPPGHSPDGPYQYNPVPQRGSQHSMHAVHHMQQYPSAYYDDNANQSSSRQQMQVPQRSSSSPMGQPANPPPPPQGNPPPPVRGPPPIQDDEEYTRRIAAEVFNRFDRDRNGTLDLQEFMDVLRVLNLAISYNDAKMKFYRADLDGNERISKLEFIEMYVRERREMLRRSQQSINY